MVTSRGGGRLVGDEHVGCVRQSHGDHHPLAHTARQLVRIGPSPHLWLGQLDPAQHLQGMLARLHPVDPTVAGDRLLDLVADLEGRVERGHRLLEDHRHAVAAQIGAAALGQAEKISTLEDDLAAGDPRRRARQQAMSANAVTLLPQPDSPTRHKVSPRRSEKETASTVSMGAAPNATDSASTSRSAAPSVMGGGPAGTACPAPCRAAPRRSIRCVGECPICRAGGRLPATPSPSLHQPPARGAHRIRVQEGGHLRNAALAPLSHTRRSPVASPGSERANERLALGHPSGAPRRPRRRGGPPEAPCGH